jgi:hypothetical protein
MMRKARKRHEIETSTLAEAAAWSQTNRMMVPMKVGWIWDCFKNETAEAGNLII